ELARIAVDTVAGRRREVADHCGAFEPRRKEARDDAVADREFRDAGADRLGDARGIGHRNAAVGRRDESRYDGIVVEIQRARMNADTDFAGTGIAWIREIDELQVVETAGFRDTYGFHAFLRVDARS